MSGQLVTTLRVRLRALTAALAAVTAAFAVSAASVDARTPTHIISLRGVGPVVFGKSGVGTVRRWLGPGSLQRHLGYSALDYQLGASEKVDFLVLAGRVEGLSLFTTYPSARPPASARTLVTAAGTGLGTSFAAARRQERIQVQTCAYQSDRQRFRYWQLNRHSRTGWMEIAGRARGETWVSGILVEEYRFPWTFPPFGPPIFPNYEAWSCAPAPPRGT